MISRAMRRYPASACPRHLPREQIADFQQTDAIDPPRAAS